MSESSRLHGLQHARPPCPSPTPKVYQNSFSLSRWCHPAIPSSVIPFSSYLQSFPESGSLQMSQFFTSGRKNIGASASVQFSRSVVSDSLRTHESQHARPPCSSPSPGVHSDSTSIESVMPSSHLILGRPLLLLPPVPPSIRVFSSESTLLMSWPKYWSFSFSITHSAKRLIRLTSFFHTKGLPLE